MEEKKPTQSVHLKNKHTDDLIDHYWASINYLMDLIKSSELKAGLILSFYGILLNFIYQSAQGLEESFGSNLILYILIGFWAFCTSASIFYCVRCFIPKIEGSYDKNMFFFKDIISKFGEIKQFSKFFFDASCDENLLFEQLGEQIYIISKIADWKFKNVKRAISFLAIGLLLLFAIIMFQTLSNFF